MPKRKKSLRDHIEKKTVFTIICSVQYACEEGGGHFPDATQSVDVAEVKTVLGAEKYFLEQGWKYDYEIGEELHIACPACVDAVTLNDPSNEE